MPKKIPLKVQKPCGFNKSFQNILTSKPGTITPLLCDELIPNTKVNLRGTIQASLPPLAFDTFMRASLKVQAFFVPMRLLVGSFEDFFTQSKRFDEDAEEDVTPLLPYLSMDDTSDFSVFAPGTLADYLGCKSADNAGGTTSYISMMPFLAYHKIYNDWFRNTKIQKDIYNYPSGSSAFASAFVRCLPYTYCNDVNNNALYVLGPSLDSNIFGFADGKTLFDLRQCNFEDDYFTIGFPQASDRDVKISVVGNQFSIGSLRGGNALQIYADRRNITGPRYIDNLRSVYGASLSEGVAQRSICLGSQEFEVYSKGIYMNSASDSPASSANPFNSVGARYGDAYAAGNGSLAEFTAEEPGYLMVLAELVPRVTYGTGLDRKFLRYVGPGSITDMANPLLQGIGNEPIFKNELLGVYCDNMDDIFAYTEKFASYKTKCDELHGLVRDGQSLDAMVLQRTFADPDTLEISSAFIEVPTDYFDQVTAVKESVSDYGYWIDSFFDYRVVQPLAPYSIPTLEDVSSEHNNTVTVREGGQRIP